MSPLVINQPFEPSTDPPVQVLLEHAVHITAIVSPDGTIRFVSPAVERMLGYPADTLVGESVAPLIHPDERSGALECLTRRGQQAGSGQLIQFRARHKDGSWRHMEAIVTNRMDDPRIAGIVVDARDITERTWSAERVQHNLEVLLAIHQVGRLLGTIPERQAVGNALLDGAQRIAPIDAAVLLLRSTGGNVWRAGAVGDRQLWSTARRAGSMRAARRRVLSTGTPQFFRARASQPGVSAIEGWDLPLHANERVIGILEVYGAAHLDGPWVEELTILADQAASALERARLYRELAEREKRLEALVRRLLLAEDDERRRIAYDIHDGLAQQAWAAQQHLEAFAAEYRTRSRKRSAKLAQALDLSSQTVCEARRVIAGLRPAILDDFGISSAISFELRALHTAGCAVEFQDGLGAIRLDPTFETALFRVVQEALTNVRKHAHALQVAVTLERRGEILHVEVRDWGRGFRLAGARAGGGRGERLGISGMQERVGLIKGRLTIRSRPGAGTRIQVQVPIRELARQAG